MNREAMDILYLSSSDWEGRWGSRQQVASALAQRGHRILFVERMAGVEHLLKYPDLRRRRVDRYRQGFRELQKNVWQITPPPLIPGHYYSKGIVRANSRLASRVIKDGLTRLSFKEPILWMFKPEHAPHIDRYQQSLSIYHCIDEFTVGTHGYKRRIISELDKAMTQAVDLVFANSALTFENRLKRNPNTIRVPSGANIAHFGRAADRDGLTERPPELASLPHERPILIFSGNINPKIDLDLLIRIAKTRPAWEMVLIGQVMVSSSQIDELRALPNVQLLGKRPFDSLPIYFRHATVCLLPYVQGEMTRFRSPLKLYEYLATGLPIISTPHPEVEEFQSLVSIIPAKEWINGLDQILTTPDKLYEARLAEAKKHSWEKRLDHMLTAIDQTLKTKNLEAKAC